MKLSYFMTQQDVNVWTLNTRIMGYILPCFRGPNIYIIKTKWYFHQKATSLILKGNIVSGFGSFSAYKDNSKEGWMTTFYETEWNNPPKKMTSLFFFMSFEFLVVCNEAWNTLNLRRACGCHFLSTFAVNFNDTLLLKCKSKKLVEIFIIERFWTVVI